MFLRDHRSRVSAVTGSSAVGDEPLDLAVAWVEEQSISGDGVLLVAPTVPQFQANEIVQRFAFTAGVRRATARTLRSMIPIADPVLVLWPDRNTLADVLDRFPGMSALCVVPWLEAEVAAWVMAVDPIRLGDTTALPRPGSGPGPGPLILDAIVNTAMTSVSAGMNHNNSITGSAGYERDHVVAALMILREHGHELCGLELEAWALRKGWRSVNAAALHDWVDRINSGYRPRLKRGVFVPDTYELWVSDAGGDKTA